MPPSVGPYGQGVLVVGEVHADRVAVADRVALILEETLYAPGREWTEANLADLHRAGDGEGVTGAGAPGGHRCRQN